MAPRDTDLSEAELQVLATLWEHGPSTVRQVLDRLRDQGRQLAYTTVLTFLSRLEHKRFVASDKSGLAYVYRPRISRERVTNSRLKAMLETFYDGAPGALVLQLVREQRLTSEEITELQHLINDLDPEVEQGGTRKDGIRKTRTERKDGER